MPETVIEVVAVLAFSALAILAWRRQGDRAGRWREIPVDRDSPSPRPKMIVQEWREGRLVTIGSYLADDDSHIDGDGWMTPTGDPVQGDPVAGSGDRQYPGPS